MKVNMFTSDYGPQQVLLMRHPVKNTWFIDEVLLKRFASKRDTDLSVLTNDASYFRVVSEEKDIDAWFIETLDVYRILGMDHPFAKWLYEEEMTYLGKRLNARSSDDTYLLQIRNHSRSLSRLLSSYGKSILSDDPMKLRRVPFDTIERLQKEIVFKRIRLNNIGIVGHNSNIVREADALVKEAEDFGRYKPQTKERTS